MCRQEFTSLKHKNKDGAEIWDQFNQCVKQYREQWAQEGGLESLDQYQKDE